MKNDLDVKEREKLFHDERFKQDIDPRKGLSKYYSITTASTDYYRSLIIEKISGEKRILEYGCGTGGDIELYKSLNCHLSGVDISKEAVLRAEKQALDGKINAKYFVGDAENTGFDNNSFDIIVGTGILHHLILEKSLTELARIATKEGCCIFIEPLGHNPFINFFRYLTPKLRTPDEHPLLEKDIILMSRYFSNVSVKYFYVFSLGAVFFRNTFVFGAIYNALLSLDNLFMKIFPSFGKYGWVCVICLSAPIKD